MDAEDWENEAVYVEVQFPWVTHGTCSGRHSASESEKDVTQQAPSQTARADD